MQTSSCALLPFLAVAVALAPTPQSPEPLKSAEVQADRRVTFRFRAPGAKEISLSRSGGKPAPMEKDEQGVWSITTEPLDPDIYSYSFVADGVRLIDPYNSQLTPNLLNVTSFVHVPGPPSLPWEISNCARETVSRGPRSSRPPNLG